MPGRSPSDRALWIVVAVQIVATAAAGAAFGTWQDEEYTLATTAHGVVYAFHRAIDYELQAPVYFVLLATLRAIDRSVFFARAVSIAAAAGFTFAAGAVARRIAPARPAWIFAALVALNPFTIFAALEIRLYAFALLVSALMWLAFYDGFFAGERRASRLAFAALALVAMYLQYFLAFELVAFAIALAVAGRPRALAAYALAMLAVAIGFSPMALVLHAQVGGAFSVPDVRPGAYGNVLLHPALDFVLPLDFAHVSGGANRLLETAVAGLVLAAIVAGRPRFDRRAVAFVAAAATIEACYLFVSDVLGYQLVAPRHFVALFLPEIAAAYAVVAAFASARARAAATAVAATVALASIVGLATTYRGLAKHGDWPRVGAYLSAVTRPGDTIAVFEADALPALVRYYRGPARVTAFPRPAPSDEYSVDAMLVHSVAQAEAALAKLPRTGRVWFVQYGDCDRFDRLGCAEVLAAIAARERVRERRTFFETTVSAIEPK